MSVTDEVNTFFITVPVVFPNSSEDAMVESIKLTCSARVYIKTIGEGLNQEFSLPGGWLWINILAELTFEKLAALNRGIVGKSLSLREIYFPTIPLIIPPAPPAAPPIL